MSITTLVETATAACPVATLTMAGTADTDALEALDADIQAWSDGYNFTLSVTVDATLAGAAGVLIYAIGQGEQTATAQPTGAYIAGWSKVVANT